MTEQLNNKNATKKTKRFFKSKPYQRRQKGRISKNSIYNNLTIVREQKSLFIKNWRQIR